VSGDTLSDEISAAIPFSRCSPIEANPIEAKGQKGGNIPIQANPGSSVATFAWDYIPFSFNILTLTLYVFHPILRVVCLLLCTTSRDFIAEKLVILYFIYYFWLTIYLFLK
jgi:hypothetical protein